MNMIQQFTLLANESFNYAFFFVLADKINELALIIYILKESTLRSMFKRLWVSHQKGVFPACITRGLIKYFLQHPRPSPLDKKIE